MPIADASLRRIYEDLINTVDKPHDYAIIISKLYAEIFNNSSAQFITVEDGVSYFFDPIRQKSLSTARLTVIAGEAGVVSNRYLAMSGVTGAGDAGFLLPRKATLTGLWAKSRSPANWTIELRRNGALVTVASVPVSFGSGFNRNINIDLDEGDWLQFYVENAANQPLSVAEIAWRR